MFFSEDFLSRRLREVRTLAVTTWRAVFLCLLGELSVSVGWLRVCTSVFLALNNFFGHTVDIYYSAAVFIPYYPACDAPQRFRSSVHGYYRLYTYKLFNVLPLPVQ